MFNFDVDVALYHAIMVELGAEAGRMERRHFPDGESYLRFETNCAERDVVIVCSLDRPDAKMLPLLLASATLYDLGAARVGLIAPYLPYMRQDTRFQPGEGVAARYVARLLADHFDWMLTVDPHLHRVHALDDIFPIPAHVVHAAPLLAEWIARNVASPILIGPDSESAQWVADVAGRIAAPYVVLEKVRSGDRSVRVLIPRLDEYRGRVPVLIDDIISTGGTLAATIDHLAAANMPAPVCVAVHAVFADGAIDALETAGASKVVTCNTIAHASNAIDVAGLIASTVRDQG